MAGSGSEKSSAVSGICSVTLSTDSLFSTLTAGLCNRLSSCFTAENAIQAFGNGSDVTVWQPAVPAQTTTATTTTAFRVKSKSLGPAGSENEIPTHVLPPCANLQVRTGSGLPTGVHHWGMSLSSFSEMHLD